MLAHLVRFALAAELAAWTVLGAWIFTRSGAGAAAFALGTVATVVAGATGIRFVVVCMTFAIAWVARLPRPAHERLGLAGSLALVAGEWRTMLANNFAWVPFDHLVLRRDPTPVPGPRIPVIVVHGYLSNRGTVSPLVHALEAAGIGPVFAPTLPSVLAPIETFAAHLGRHVREVTAATGQPRAILVAHSMGGLASRALLRAQGSERIAGLVTLGSPHHGSVVARLGMGDNGREMRAGSDFLRALAAAEGDAGPGCPALSVYTLHDNLVAPQDSSRLAWARNEAIAGVGHLAMLTDARVHRAVVEEVVRLGARSPGR